MTYKFILAAFENSDISTDQSEWPLVKGIKHLFDCQEVEFDCDVINETARIAIANPQRFHWLGEDDMARVERAIKAGDI